MKLTKHPNVVHLHEVMAGKTKIYIVLEFVNGGQIFDEIVRLHFISFFSLQPFTVRSCNPVPPSIHNSTSISSKTIHVLCLHYRNATSEFHLRGQSQHNSTTDSPPVPKPFTSCVCTTIMYAGGNFFIFKVTLVGKRS